MNLRIAMLLIAAMIATAVWAGDPRKPYNPKADARLQVSEAVKVAAAENKHVLIQVGGNWCSWCLKLNNLYLTDKAVGEALNSNYVLVHLHTSKEGENSDILAELGYPQRFGYPVLVVLDAKGNRIHTQNSVYLEKGEGHDPKKVIGFLNDWAPKALKPPSNKG